MWIVNEIKKKENGWFEIFVLFIDSFILPFFKNLIYRLEDYFLFFLFLDSIRFVLYFILVSNEYLIFHRFTYS